MNDNDGLLQPTSAAQSQHPPSVHGGQSSLLWFEYTDPSVCLPRPVLFGTDIPDPTAIGDDVSITYKIEGTFGPREIYRPTFERYYEIDDTPARAIFHLSQAFAWCVIMLMLALALYSIVWGM